MRLISLARFFLDCLLAYFKPGMRWTAQTPLRLLLRMVYYFCNWCYSLFIYTAEALVFFSQWELRKVDRALMRHYFYPNQFWIALTEGLKVERPETLYRLTYGETTWFGISSMLNQVKASSSDVFYDLGCGTGRNVFFARIQYGMRATGVDLIHSFVNYANQVVQQFQLSQIQFLEQNIFATPLHEATVVFVTANCYDQQTMGQLIQRFEDLPMGARVISTHRSIPSPRLRITGSQRLPFSWGVDQVFYQEVQASNTQASTGQHS